MSVTKTVTVKTLTNKEMTGKNGPYRLFNLETTSGEKFVLFGGINSEKPRVNKQEVEINQGDTLGLICEQVGKNVTILDVKKLQASASEIQFTETSPAKASVKKEFSNSNQGSAITSMSKDLSMELSGLLQALLSTGRYHEEKPVTLDSGKIVNNTFINTKLLEIHVKKILESKDNLAAERVQS